MICNVLHDYFAYSVVYFSLFMILRWVDISILVCTLFCPYIPACIYCSKSCSAVCFPHICLVSALSGLPCCLCISSLSATFMLSCFMTPLSAHLHLMSLLLTLVWSLFSVQSFLDTLFYIFLSCLVQLHLSAQF